MVDAHTDYTHNTYITVYEDEMVSETQELLQNLVNLLNQAEVKSKQTAFNLCYEDLSKAKELASWDAIANYVNEHTKEQLTGRIASNMFQRAKANRDKQSKKRLSTKNSLKSTLENVKDNESNEAENHIAQDLLKEYMKVCFNKEIIARNAIENNISLELIQQWRCPNFVQLNNAIGNYIRNK